VNHQNLLGKLEFQYCTLDCKRTNKGRNGRKNNLNEKLRSSTFIAT